MPVGERVRESRGLWPCGESDNRLLFHDDSPSKDGFDMGVQLLDLSGRRFKVNFKVTCIRSKKPSQENSKNEVVIGERWEKPLESLSCLSSKAPPISPVSLKG